MIVYRPGDSEAGARAYAAIKHGAAVDATYVPGPQKVEPCSPPAVSAPRPAEPSPLTPPALHGEAAVREKAPAAPRGLSNNAPCAADVESSGGCTTEMRTDRETQSVDAVEDYNAALTLSWACVAVH